jgi:hypothetical protein
MYGLPGLDSSYGVGSIGSNDGSLVRFFAFACAHRSRIDDDLKSCFRQVYFL